ncbi:MAG: peptidoglycan-associated lipoprotein [Verrucomicrobiota bacterium]|jgi:peptidoglycan-associated lipoprotein
MPQRLLAAALALALVSSCSSGKTKTKTASQQDKVALPETQGPKGPGTDGKDKLPALKIEDLVTPDKDGVSKLNQLPVVKHDIAAVHFDFDSAAIKPEEAAKVQAMAAFLTANPKYVCVIKGHSDERGSEEYNRALSERRALAVKEALIQNTAALAPRLNSQSMGEENSTPNGNDAVWSAERRAEFEVLDAGKAQ